MKNTKTQDHLMPFSITSLLRMSAIIIIFYSTNTPFKFIPWRVNVRTVWWCYSIWSCTIYKEVKMFHDHPYYPHMISTWQKALLYEIMQDMLQYPESDWELTSVASQTSAFYPYKLSWLINVIIISVQIPTQGGTTVSLIGSWFSDQEIPFKEMCHVLSWGFSSY